MASSSEIHNLLYTFDLYRGMQENRLEYIYRGPFSDKVVENLMLLAESNLREDPTALSTKKKLYFLMVESLQNITRHQHEEESEVASEKSGLFIIRKVWKRYFLTTGNLIHEGEIEGLKDHIDKINSLSTQELKSQYRKVLDEGKISPKGGAGLGLIGMARKSGNKLDYSFKQVDDQHWYFYLNMALDDIHPEEDEEEMHPVSGTYFDNISSIHDMLNTENVLLNYCGSFQIDSYGNIKEIIGSQVPDTYLALRLQTVILELVQNISLHGSNLDKKKGKPSGILVFSIKDGKYRIATGNFIENDKVSYFEDEIEKSCRVFNILTSDSEEQTPRLNGQSFMKIQMASKNCLDWEVQPINEEFSFVTILATVE